MTRKTFSRPKKSPNCQELLNKKTEKGLALWIDSEGFTDPNCSILTTAECIGVSHEQLSYYFSSVLKTKFRTFWKEKRICKAMDLFKKYPDRSINSISQMVGITDPSNFRKQFKEVTGQYPQEWKSEQEGNKPRRLMGRFKDYLFK